MNKTRIRIEALTRALLVSLTLVMLPTPSTAQCVTEKLLPHDGKLHPFQFFGHSVALWEDTALVGARGGDRAYFFERVGGAWAELHHVEPGFASAWFGYSVDIAGDWAVIGAPLYDDGPLQGVGIAIVYKRGTSNWIGLQRLTVPVKEEWAGLGMAVAMDQNRIVLGASGATGNYPWSGAAYVFEFDQQTGMWVLAAKLIPSDGNYGDLAGESVAIDGDVIVVGAPSKPNGNMLGAGAAYVFENVGGGWVQTAKLLGDGHDDEVFAYRNAVGIHDDTILIGALGNRAAAGGFESGAAFLFQKNLTGWEKVQTLIPSDPQRFAAFGVSVAIGEDTAVVGSSADYWLMHGVQDFWGSAYHFGREGGVWKQEGKLLAPNEASTFFGVCVDLWGGEALVGVERDQENCTLPACLTGSAYVFELGKSAEQYCSCRKLGPCGNNDEHGGCGNSDGQGATLQACGSGSVATDDLKMECRWMPRNVAGIVFMGPQADQRPLGDGILCVGPGNTGYFRFPDSSSGGEGVITLGPGIATYARASFPAAGHIHPGDTWYFQAWYRDPKGPCGTGFNLSNGLKVEFTP